MVGRKKGNKLERWEIALVKAMLAAGKHNDQDILAYFTRPTRSINHARIAEIRTGHKHRGIKAASEAELDAFLLAWPDINPETGLSPRGDELLIKSREAMIAAVHVFNSAGLTFRAELFIVTSIIAWTYLMHAWFKREGIDYRYRKADGSIRATKNGADQYLELGACIRHAKCPLKRGVIQNLEFLLEIRHEVEHRSTDRIDDAISAKLQSCCLNFNTAIKDLFGKQYELERELPLALQFLTFSADQRQAIKASNALPSNIESLINAFEEKLTDEEYRDPAYRYRVAYVPIAANRSSAADETIQFVKPETSEGQEINKLLLKEVNKQRYPAKKIVKMMRKEGFPKFTIYAHTKLWKELDGKNPGKGYGQDGDYKGMWVWYDRWLERVRAHCQENAEKYQ